MGWYGELVWVKLSMGLTRAQHLGTLCFFLLVIKSLGVFGVWAGGLGIDG